jgi:putative glutamine amidotransferase
MTAPLIALTTYPRDPENKVHARIEYIDSVRRAGGIPLLVAPGEMRVAELLERVDGLLLIGGGDIDPALYHGRTHETIYNVDAERDRSEIALVRHAAENAVPTLGICRGAQIINVALGGTLVEHVPDVAGEKVAHRTPDRQPTRHPVAITPGSRLARILGVTDLEPSSWHHQAVRAPAPGLSVVAHAPDGTIEAIEKADHPWLVGIQFHCELRAAVDPTEQRVFDELVRAAALRTSRRK